VGLTVDQRRARRIFLTLLVMGAAFGVVLSIILTPSPAPAPGSPSGGGPPQGPAAAQPVDVAAAAGTVTQSPLAREAAQASQPPPGAAAMVLAEVAGLRAAAPPAAPGGPPQPIGSLDPRQARLYLEPSENGAGLARITLAAHWEDALARHRADAHYAAAPGDPNPPPLPDPALRYVLHARQQLGTFSVPVLAAHSVKINGQTVDLFGPVWASPEPGAFTTEVRDGEGRLIVQIERRFILGEGYGLRLQQRIVNAADGPLDIQWIQYGPDEMPIDRSRYIDLRRFIFGYQPDPARHPNLVFSGKSDLTLDRSTVFDRFQEASQPGVAAAEVERLQTLWPASGSGAAGYGLSWFAATNRYFTLAVHPPAPAENSPAPPSLDTVVAQVRHLASNTANSSTAVIFTYLYSPVRRVAAGETTSFDLGLYAGPLDRRVLGDREPYASLNLQGLILNTKGGMSSWCTFQWLAHLLLAFLTLLHDWIVFDWGLAIIGLVVVVRTLLHPLTKRSQVSIQRFGKQMQAMKPEIDKLQQKYAGDPKKMQQEQLRLMREHGVSPFQALGCLPMFLQMPIWIALYAMLYFAFELRQQAAFFGLFQVAGDWAFLADLSAQDNFIPLGNGFVIPLINSQITSINILPLLMALVFYVQQKYMTPPPSPTMTREQLQQQKIMKVMMVVLFPLFMYKVSSGLTLYIFTSTCIGILESRYIRRHVERLDLTAKPGAGAGSGAGPGAGAGAVTRARKKPRDAIARAYLAALERRKEKLQERQARSFKKRK
jgi:YidC/Oxa1 family membrane protein insertase